ncbi:RagB/SusD family nutrient uptake outer membrane protein [Niabella hibiscisoli]|uniref:RagB/SusD family nutrient uptake outer membrane protein n=1 Tax=Niabella hibiscisoli TaxID=1825928 RepID=UPI0021D45A5A|nr:RagB/SusD family nutrient uptake outer membrane protein [Niabella hibiscisoli]
MALSFSDQTLARNYVRDERRREFVNEGVNFFDEMRWKTLKETKFNEKVAQHAWGGTESTGGTTYEWVGDYWYTWPVPKAETELNRNLKPTPGWVY